jgi:uncharacterized protein
MNRTYLDAARQGQNQWWRYLLGILLTLFLWFIVGGLITGIGIALLIAVPLLAQNLEPAALQTQLQQQLQRFLETASVETFVAINIPFLFFLLGLWIAVKTIHQRRFRSLISADRTFNWQRLWYGFSVWFVLLNLSTAISIMLEPQNFRFSFDPSQWIPLLIAALILTPIQTATEELFFRGYLLQGLGLLTRQPFLLIMGSSFLFTVPHLGNPEIDRGVVWLTLIYFAIGAFLALITLKDDRLELAIGVHAANNLSFIFSTTEDSALRMPALWTQQRASDPRLDLVALLLFMAIAYYLFFGLRRRVVHSNTPER